MFCMRSNVRRLGRYGDYVFGAGREEEIKKTHPDRKSVGRERVF